MSTNIAEGLARELVRVSYIRHHYEAIGPAGGFALTLMNLALDAGIEAFATGDVGKIIAAYRELEGFKE